MKPLLTIVFAVLFVFVAILWGAYGETQLQYNTYQQLFSKHMECRIEYLKITDVSYVDRACGKIPTWNDFVYEILKDD